MMRKRTAIQANLETPARQHWEETPSHITSGDATPAVTKQWDQTPSETPASTRKNRWDETPKESVRDGGLTPGWGAETPRDIKADFETKVEETPGASKRRSRWDLTPSQTPMVGAETPTNGVLETPGKFTPNAANQNGNMTPKTPSLMTPSGATPIGTPAMGLKTPAPHMIPMTPEQMQIYKWEKEIDDRNRPLTDEELDALIPPGYKILAPPSSYIPIRTPARKLLATPTPIGGLGGFSIPMTPERGGGLGDKTIGGILDTQPKDKELPALKPEDIQYFDKLLLDVDENTLSKAERNEREIMTYLLKIKNGTPPQRKSGLRKITENARRLGAGPLFNQILPLLMSPTLEDQERHLMVKVIDRILYKLDDLVRPYVHKILVVIEPLLIDEDYYARVEGLFFFIKIFCLFYCYFFRS